MVLALLASVWDRSVALKDRENSEGNRKPTALADDVYEALLDLVECVQLLCDTGEPAKGYESNNTMVISTLLHDSGSQRANN